MAYTSHDEMIRRLRNRDRSPKPIRYELPNFVNEWMFLEKQGKCDGFLGAQYRRIKQEWIDAGKPEPRAFILRRSNIDDQGREPEVRS